MSKKYTRRESFKFAIEGLKTGLREEPNLAIEISIGIFIIFLASFLQISAIEWGVLIITIFSVISLELINTSLESLLDVVSPSKNPTVKKAKDTSAAALLMMSIASIIIGVVIFLPKFLPIALKLLGIN